MISLRSDHWRRGFGPHDICRSPYHRRRQLNGPETDRSHAGGKQASFGIKPDDVLYPQVPINVDVHSKPDIETVPEIVDAIKSVESELGDRGRVLVRYSGTQPLPCYGGRTQ